MPSPAPSTEPVEPLRLRLYPDPVLMRRALPIPSPEADPAAWDQLRERVDKMFDIMYESRGIGIAAPQVGWSARIFVINLTSEPDFGDEELVFVNPEITAPKGEDSMEEGCLSLPDIRAEVDRPERISIRALDEWGNPFEISAYGMLARCIQHEFDHLDGILFVKRLGMTAKMKVKRALKDLEKKYKEERA